MAKKSKYESLADAVVWTINDRLREDVQNRIKQYEAEILKFSEEDGDFNECIQKYPSIAPYISKAYKDWIEQEQRIFIKHSGLKSQMDWSEERLIEGKIALFTDEQLSNLTIEELASLVRS